MGTHGTDEHEHTVNLKIDLNPEQYAAFAEALCEYRSQREIGRKALLQWLRDEGYMDGGDGCD